MVPKNPAIQRVTINDFTPGIYASNFSSAIYSTQTPLGSASTAYRCIARKGIGLIPLPSFVSGAVANNGANAWTAITAMCCVGSTEFGVSDQLIIGWLNSTGRFNIDYWHGDGNGSIAFGQNNYSHTAGSDVGMVFNNMVPFFTISGAGPFYEISAVTIDPTATAMTWVTSPAWNASAASATGTITVNIAALTTGQVAQQTSRCVFILPVGYNGIVGQGSPGAGTGIWTSDLNAMTNITGPSFFEPSQANNIGAFGSVSTGEFVFIYQAGGAVVVSGDIGVPNSAIRLPAVVGTGRVIGPAVASTAGMVYVTDYDGVYAWNGGNTSQKLSTQLPDTSFKRQQYTADLTQSYAYLSCLTHHDVWNDWICFAGNYMFDCENNSWWLLDNPAAVNFQVFTGSHNSSQFFYAADGYTTVNSGNVNLYQFNKAKPQSSYLWVSNPMPVPTSRTWLTEIEIVASNLSNTPCTITVTPGPLTTPFPNNQIPSQPISFTIPANTSSWRGSKKCGYQDYNLTVQVFAANSNTNNPAPALHEITLGFTERETAVE